MFCHNTRLSFFACQKDAAGATLKKAAQALVSGQQQKIGSGSTLKVVALGASGSATLVRILILQNIRLVRILILQDIRLVRILILQDILLVLSGQSERV